MLDVECQCGTRFKLTDEWAGRQVKCPACGGVFAIAQRRSSPQAQQPIAMAPHPISAAPTAAPVLLGRLGPRALRQATVALVRNVMTRFHDAGAAKWAVAATGAAVLAVAVGLFASRLVSGQRKHAPVVSGTAQPHDKALDNDPPREGQAAVTDAAAVAVDTVASSTVEPPRIGVDVTTSSPTDSAAAPSPPGTGAAGDLATESKRASAPRPRTRRAKRSGELSGVSRNYDDLHCQLIQSRHGARVPQAATIIEVDGDRLPIANPSALVSSRAPVVFLPRGRHAVRFRGNESLISISVADDLLDEYWAMRDFFDAGGAVRDDELLSRSARALDSHSAPMLLNLMGAAQAAKGRWAAAERKFRRSLRVNPCFSPAHLNLAHCLERRDAKSEAARELRLAAVFNVGNVFGLAAGIHELAGKLDVATDKGEPIAFDPGWYLAAEAGSLTEEDRRLTALLVALSKYAQLDTERAKVLNNLGVHFADSGRAEVALDHFQGALAVLKQAGPERFAVAREVLTHMSDACRVAGLEEADEYERMRALVSP